LYSDVGRGTQLVIALGIDEMTRLALAQLYL
jgi:hypothetical protein